jgi:hypothetical protein
VLAARREQSAALLTVPDISHLATLRVTAHLDAHDAQNVRQVDRDLDIAWPGPPVIPRPRRPGRRTMVTRRDHPRGHSPLRPGSYLRAASGRPGSQPTIDGDTTAATALLATHIEF